MTSLAGSAGGQHALTLGSGPFTLLRPCSSAKAVTASLKLWKASVGKYVNVVPLSSTVPYPSSYLSCTCRGCGISLQCSFCRICVTGASSKGRVQASRSQHSLYGMVAAAAKRCRPQVNRSSGKSGAGSPRQVPPDTHAAHGRCMKCISAALTGLTASSTSPTQRDSSLML